MPKKKGRFIRVTVGIQSVTPLLMNRFDESPWIPGEDPQVIVERKLYRDSDGAIGIPHQYIYWCLERATRLHRIGPKKRERFLLGLSELPYFFRFHNLAGNPVTRCSIDSRCVVIPGL